MPRSTLILIVLLLVLIGGAILLSRSVKPVPTQTIEVNVGGNAVQK